MDKIDLGLEDVCRVIGYDLTRLLAAWFSNNYLYVPAQHRDDHPLRALIGDRPLRALIEAHAGERVWVPASSEDGRHRRDRLVAEMVAAGASVDAIAAFLEMASRRVETLRSELEARGLLVYVEGYRRRSRGRPIGGQRELPDIGVR